MIGCPARTTMVGPMNTGAPSKSNVAGSLPTYRSGSVAIDVLLRSRLSRVRLATRPVVHTLAAYMDDAPAIWPIHGPDLRDLEASSQVGPHLPDLRPRVISAGDVVQQDYPARPDQRPVHR